MAANDQSKPMTPRQYRAMADFRYELRRFLRYSEELTRRHELTPLQYQLMLQIKGFPGRERATIGELAERMQAKHHGMVALVTRCVKAGLVARRVDEQDRRNVFVELTAKGEQLLEPRLTRDFSSRFEPSSCACARADRPHPPWR